MMMSKGREVGEWKREVGKKGKGWRGEGKGEEVNEEVKRGY